MECGISPSLIAETAPVLTSARHSVSCFTEKMEHPLVFHHMDLGPHTLPAATLTVNDILLQLPLDFPALCSRISQKIHFCSLFSVSLLSV